VTERVLLLPSADGHRSAILVSTADGEVLLDEPMSVVEVRDGKIRQFAIPPAEAEKRYAPVIKAMPVPPKRFTLYFVLDKTDLVPGSRPVLERIRNEAAALPAPEIVIIGHTDRLGSVARNDELSILRARKVRDAFLAIGVPLEMIKTEGRGEREPAVPTADDVPEPRNRRAEIKIR
jgi:outer membrane protein OmpA-like peptidoglycan-associated protein